MKKIRITKKHCHSFCVKFITHYHEMLWDAASIYGLACIIAAKFAHYIVGGWAIILICVQVGKTIAEEE